MDNHASIHKFSMHSYNYQNWINEPYPVDNTIYLCNYTIGYLISIQC